jgi:hypothetical protein
MVKSTKFGRETSFYGYINMQKWGHHKNGVLKRQGTSQNGAHLKPEVIYPLILNNTTFGLNAPNLVEKLLFMSINLQKWNYHGKMVLGRVTIILYNGAYFRPEVSDRMNRAVLFIRIRNIYR